MNQNIFIITGRPKRRPERATQNDRVSTNCVEECSKGPKDSRLEPTITVNGIIPKKYNKSESHGLKKQETKITNYFLPSRFVL